MLQTDSVDGLPLAILTASQCLEGKTTTDGLVSKAWKTKSLVEQWLSKPFYDKADSKGTVIHPYNINIKRDVIVTSNVKVGSGLGACNVVCSFRVLNIYEKYYNKWFISKNAFKMWKKKQSCTN